MDISIYLHHKSKKGVPMKKIAIYLMTILFLTGCASSAKPLTMDLIQTQQEDALNVTKSHEIPEDEAKISLETPVEEIEEPSLNPLVENEVEIVNEISTPVPNNQNETKKTPIVSSSKQNDTSNSTLDSPSPSKQKPIAEVKPQPTPEPIVTPVPPTPTPQPTPAPVKEKWLIPNLVGVGKDNANSQLCTLNSKMGNLGFNPMKISFTEQEHAQIPKGDVISQSLAPGKYDNVSEISLCISSGAPVATGGKNLPQNYPYEFRSGLENEVFNLVNQHRANNGLAPYIWSNSLHETSRYKSNSMVQHDYFSHNNPQLDGKGSSYLLWELFGVPYNSIGENIASRSGYSSVSAEDIFTQWKNSKGHNDNMLSSKFTHMGVGIVYSSNPGSNYKNTKSYISTQHFGK